jgi:xylan 1,4-beta-xylosidase
MAVYYAVGGITACLADAVDLRPYSTESAGGFTGCTVGMYSSANGTRSGSEAAFAWFAVRNL